MTLQPGFAWGALRMTRGASLALVAAVATAFATCLVALPACAQAPAAPATSAPATEGEVRKVDREQGKVTLRHGRIENLDMGAMTMVFRVADPRLLEGLQPGAKVRFDAESVGGALTVTRIEPAR